MRAGSRLTDGRPLDGDYRHAATVIRTCIGCRQRASATDLLRVVATPAGAPDQSTWVLLPDPRRHQPGRGAWLHPVLDCVERAERRRAYGRALRISAQPDPVAVRSYVESLTSRHAAGR